jgi:hypothetical protein
MDIQVRALRDFMSPIFGDIETGQIFELESGIAHFWLVAGLVESVKPYPPEILETKPEPVRHILNKRGRPPKAK